jgi:hypothetical protein
LKLRIRTQHDTKFLVDGVFLCSLDAPDISTGPVFVEQYAIELPKKTHQQSKQISYPQTLDNSQCELMEIHCMKSSPASSIDYTCRKRKN